MKQTIHIFVKDARRCWPFIALVAGLTALMAWLAPQESPVWMHETAFMNRALKLVQLLLPVAWWLAIAHAVQGESLVGSRQFWVTRPYSWRSLLAAKLLFAVVFVMLPLLTSDWTILAGARFSPAGMLPDLLRRQFGFSLLLLPAFLIAALTRGVRQFIMSCFAIVIGIVALAGVQSLHPASPAPAVVTSVRSGSWLQEWGDTVGYVGGVFALLVWQYARRQTAAARTVVALVCAGLFVSSGWPSQAQDPAPAPVSAAHPEIAVVFAPERGRFVPDYPSAVPDDRVHVEIPIRVAGRDRDLVDLRMGSVSMQSSRGDPWSHLGAWQGQFIARRSDDWLSLYLDRQTLERLRGEPVSIGAIFGVVLYEPQAAITILPNSGWTRIPGFGDVNLPDGGGTPLLWCRVPLRYPAQKILYTVRAADSMVVVSGHWAGMYPEGADFPRLTPVELFAVGPEPNGRWQLRPAATVHVAVERPIDLIRRDLRIPAIHLEDYIVGAR